MTLQYRMIGAAPGKMGNGAPRAARVKEHGSHLLFLGWFIP